MISSRKIDIMLCISMMANCALIYQHEKSSSQTIERVSVNARKNAIPARFRPVESHTIAQNIPIEQEPLKPEEISFGKNDVTEILAETGFVLPLSEIVAKTLGVVPADIPILNQAIVRAINSIEEIEKKIATLETDEKGPFFHIPEFGNEMDLIIHEFRNKCRKSVSIESWPAVEILTCAPHFHSGYSDVKISAFVDGQTVGISYTKNTIANETTSAISFYLSNRYRHFFDFEKIKSAEAAKNAPQSSSSR